MIDTCHQVRLKDSSESSSIGSGFFDPRKAPKHMLPVASRMMPAAPANGAIFLGALAASSARRKLSTAILGGRRTHWSWNASNWERPLHRSTTPEFELSELSSDLMILHLRIRCAASILCCIGSYIFKTFDFRQKFTLDKTLCTVIDTVSPENLPDTESGRM